MKKRKVSISLTDLPNRSRELNNDEISRVFGGECILPDRICSTGCPNCCPEYTCRLGKYSGVFTYCYPD
jgi:hypothetical protein